MSKLKPQKRSIYSKALLLGYDQNVPKNVYERLYNKRLSPDIAYVCAPSSDTKVVDEAFNYLFNKFFQERGII